MKGVLVIDGAEYPNISRKKQKTGGGKRMDL